MNKLMTELRLEHKGIDQLLAMLQSKLEKLNQGTSPNFRVMDDAINYIGNYAGAYHHPKEDVIYNYMIERQLDQRGLFSAIMQEHKSFAQVTNNLKQAIESILNDTIVPREVFIAQLDAFIQAEKNHLEQEDNVIFPIIESLLTEQDWIAISQSIPAQIEDPLFGKQVASEYMELFQRLLETEKS